MNDIMLPMQPAYFRCRPVPLHWQLAQQTALALASTLLLPRQTKYRQCWRQARQLLPAALSLRRHHGNR
jgi:hypothetical protein